MRDKYKNLFRYVSRLIPDSIYLRLLYRMKMHKKLNLSNPQTFTEKLQWLKLNDRKPLYTTMVDKYEAKKYAAGIIGEQYIIPTLGLWERFEDIDFDSLPEQFALKCTHDSGGSVIVHNKADLNKEQARKVINRSLKNKYFYHAREWPYKNVKPRIIAESFMEDKEDGELRDYKFFTFGGVPRLLYITQGRGSDENTAADFFDMDFNHLDLKIDHEAAKTPPHKPQNFELMKELAAKLSTGTPELRVDFYEVNGQVFFGELTFFHCSGLRSLNPDGWDEILGSWTELPLSARE